MDDDEMADGQIWPAKEWFVTGTYTNGDKEFSVAFVQSGKTAEEAFRKARTRLERKGGEDHYISDMKPL